MTATSQLAVYSGLIVVAALLGSSFPLLRRWTETQFRVFLGFAAGVLLGAAFLHMAPDAFGLLGQATGMFILLGFLTLYIIEKYVAVHICNARGCEIHEFRTLGWATFVGRSVHALMDGVALGSAVLLSAQAHPAGGPPHCAMGAIVFFALMTPLGAALPLISLQPLTSRALGIATAVSVGTFLHIALSDLLPELHKHLGDRNRNLAAFLGGSR